MVSLASPRSLSFHRTSTGFTTWPAMSGNGSAIGIDAITTCNSLQRETLREIPEARIRRTTPPNQRRKSASIEEDHFSAATSIARATWSAHVAKAKSAPAAITSDSDASRMGLKSGLDEHLEGNLYEEQDQTVSEHLVCRHRRSDMWRQRRLRPGRQAQHRNYLGR